jgi:hypothetical protein
LGHGIFLGLDYVFRDVSRRAATVSVGGEAAAVGWGPFGDHTLRAIMNDLRRSASCARGPEQAYRV